MRRQVTYILLDIDGHTFDGTRWRHDDDPFWSDGVYPKMYAHAQYFRTLKRVWREVRRLQQLGLHGAVERAGRCGARGGLRRCCTWSF